VHRYSLRIASAAPQPSRIPKPTARRLSLYLRALQAWEESDSPRASVSSRELGDSVGVADAQVRKDLASIGATGQPGVGYAVAELVEDLRRSMGIQRTWRVVLVGAGNIGRALLAYPRFAEEGFELVAVFDRATGVVGRKLAGLTVQPMSAMADTVRRTGAELGIVAVPPSESQQVAERLVAAGIRGVLNFAPRPLKLPPQVAEVAVDFTETLERLAFEVSMKPGPGTRSRDA
jgi:redox-sensing transcriptional repressor